MSAAQPLPTNSSSSAGSMRCDLMTAGLAAKRSERRRATRWQRCTRGVHHHGEQRVVPLNPDRINHTLLAELCDRTLIRHVAHAPVPLELGAQVVEDLLVLGHVIG